jgi:hypothetical protein
LFCFNQFTHPGASEEKRVHLAVRGLCWVAGRRPGNGGHHLYGRVLTVRHWSRRATSLRGAKSVSAATHVPGRSARRLPPDTRLVGWSTARGAAVAVAHHRRTRGLHTTTAAAAAPETLSQTHFAADDEDPPRLWRATHTGGTAAPPTSTMQSVSRYRFYPTCSAAFRIIKVTASCEINTRSR